MPSNLQPGDRVFVPRSLLGMDQNAPSAFCEATVENRQNRSVRVRLANGDVSDWIGASRISKNVGVLIFRIGDFHESMLLDPLFKSILQFSRLLLPDDHVRAIEVRTLEEFRYFWLQEHDAYQQVVLIGHGSPKSIRFGANDVDAETLIDAFRVPDVKPKELISLCCETGQAPFGKAMSAESFCEDFMAPYHNVHGCVAAQFCQDYLTRRFLDGHTTGTAFKKARENLVGTVIFRRWHNGRLHSGPK